MICFRPVVAFGLLFLGLLCHSAGAQVVQAPSQPDPVVLQIGDSFELSQRRLEAEFSKRNDVSIWRCFALDLSSLNLEPAPDFRSAVILVFYSEEQNAGTVAIFPSHGQEPFAAIVAGIERTSSGFDIVDGSGGEYTQRIVRALTAKATSRAPATSSAPVSWRSILSSSCE